MASTYTKSEFENLYNRYNKTIFGLALQIAPTSKQAEEILIETFRKASLQHLKAQNNLSPCVSLIKLALQTAHEKLDQYPVNWNFKLKKLSNSLILHQLLCGQVSLENLCEDGNISREQAAKSIRAEILTLRNIIQESEFASASQ